MWSILMIFLYIANLMMAMLHLKCVLEALRCEKLYANVEKCVFCMDHVIFLGFTVSSQGVEVDPEKVKAIQDWPTPKNMR